MNLPDRNTTFWQEGQERVRVVSSNYQCLNTDEHILANDALGAIELILPKSRNGKIIRIVKVGGGNSTTIVPYIGDSIVLPYGLDIQVTMIGTSFTLKSTSNSSWVIE
jgi:hypothetical protein